MQRVVSSRYERWDEIQNRIKFDQALNETRLMSYELCWRTLRMSLLGTKGSWGGAQ
jgi:hypothetical protein